MPIRRLFADQAVHLSKLPSFRAEHFPPSGPLPWLDRPDAFTQIEQKLKSGALTLEEAEQCRHWATKGYITLSRFIDDRLLDEVWDAYESSIRSGRIVLQPEKAGESDPYPGRFLNPHKKLGAFCEILKHPRLLRWLRVLLDRESKPLQTIASHKGSQQSPHSDSIHMTTYPLGYLTAAWIAFEDIHPDSGPLVYYPGSQRLPYTFSKDVGISEADFKREGYAAYQANYEPHVKQLIEKHDLEPHYFHAKKGDVLIWHANLLHGGSPRHDLSRSRRAMVCHYFAKGSFVYHDLASAKSKQQYLGTCLLRTETGEPSLLGRLGLFGKWR